MQTVMIMVQQESMDELRGEVRGWSQNRLSSMRAPLLPKNQEPHVGGNDVDLKDKNPVTENVTGDRSQKWVEDGLNICTVLENGERKAGIQMMKTKRRRWWMYTLACALFLSLVSPMAAGSTVLNTNQNLPPACIARLKKKEDCPDKRIMGAWLKLDRECCGGSDGRVLHCQELERNASYVPLPACLPDQTVPPGKIGQLIINSAGFPEVDLSTDCPPDSYRQNSVQSSSIRFAICQRKMKGNVEEEEKVCDGGTTQDDRFVCRKGWHTVHSCPQGRNGSSAGCTCVRLDCPEGQRPDRNISGSCSDGSFRVDYNCTEARPSREGHTSTLPPTAPPQATSPVTPDDQTTGCAPGVGVVVGVFVAGVVGGVVGVLLSVFVLYKHYTVHRRETHILCRVLDWLFRYNVASYQGESTQHESEVELQP